MNLRRCESPGNAARIAALSADHAPTAIIGCPHTTMPIASPVQRDKASFGFSSSQANGGNFVDQNDDAEEAAPRVDASQQLVEGPDDQTSGSRHLGHCRYCTVRIREPEDRRRDQKDAEREVWCLSNGDRSRLAVAETPEQKSSHHRARPIQIRISRNSRHSSVAKLVASRNESSHRCRRLAKDFENLTRNGLAFLRLASIRLMLRKLRSH
jgi:transposase